ncbi:hypothetical protein GCM10009825_30130 [Arthrobacter humicola]|uniref:Uncharacterized protein n=1 Tax=Arthrobacter humicola TaxID=409291 RepID=A0ABN2ZG71_9MICC
MARLAANHDEGRGSRGRNRHRGGQPRPGSLRGQLPATAARTIGHRRQRRHRQPTHGGAGHGDRWAGHGNTGHCDRWPGHGNNTTDADGDAKTDADGVVTRDGRTDAGR